MKSGYYLVMDNGELYGPIANDNHERDTYLDARIIRKVEYWSKRLKQEWKFISEGE